MRNRIVTGLGAAGLALLLPTSAFAGPNDITLQRFVRMERSMTAQIAVGEEQLFRDFSRDIGLIFAPRLATTGETLGVSGFSVQLDQSVSLVDSSSEYWQLGAQSGDPSGSLQTSTLHIRKGLPFSFEVGGTITKMWGSELMGVGAELRFAPLEDILWPGPDLAFRGFVSTVLGDTQLAMLLPGWDVVMSVPIGVGNVMNISPFAGYNMTVVVASSRLIDAEPTNPQSAYTTDGTNPSGGQPATYQPEVLFDDEATIVSQGIFGVRFEFAVVDLTFQGTVSSAVQSYTTSLGFSF